MKTYSFYAGLFLAACLSVVACNNRTTQRVIETVLNVDPPFESMVIGCSGNVIDNQKGGEILYESGSKLVIPPNAFVDSKGNPVEGDVEVNYREFRSSAEIMTSGIPMNFKQNGEYENFQSAGMFEITANHNGDELSLASGKEITCHMMTEELEEDYNFYSFNEETKEWIEVQGQDKTVKTTIGKEGEETPAEFASLESGPEVTTFKKPLPPRKADMNLPVFEIGESENAKKEDDTPVNAVGTVSKSVLWQFAPGYDISKASMDKVLSGSNWNDYTLEEVNKEQQVYRLELGKKTGDPIFITPVLFGKDYRKAMAKYEEQLKEFNEQAKKINDENQYQEKKKQFWRTASVANLGIHNWDRLMKRRDAVKLQASFALESGAEIPQGTQVFMLTGNKKEIITFYPAMFANFAFDPKVENTLISILPGDKMAIFKKEAFEKLDIGSLRRKGEHKFVLKTVVAKLGGVEDLQKFIDSL